MTRFRAAIEQHGVACILPLLVIAAGCTNLEFLEPNSCGNLVVESEAGEDCDGADGCNAPGSANACRYTCESGSTGCPTNLGFQCGADFICRRPSGQFSIGRTTTTETARDLIVGDVNADGCAEVVVTAVRSTTVTAFASDRSKSCVASAQTLRSNRPEPGRTPPTPLPLLQDLIPGDDSKKQSLISGGTSIFGDGLSLHFANETPTLFPVLFPRAERPATSMRPVTAKLLGSDALVVLEQRSDSKTDIVIQSSAQKGPQVFMDALAAKVDDIAAIAIGDFYSPPGATKPCDEIVIGRRGSKTLDIYQLCTAAGDYQFVPGPIPSVMLHEQYKIRQKNARILAVDVNGDNKLDLASNCFHDEDFVPCVAYGLGDGRFHSVPMPLPPGGMPDEKTSTLLDDGAKMAAAENMIFVAVEKDANHPGVEFYNPPCPPFDEEFTSPTCGPVTGDCEAVVVDIDNDGDQDLVVSEGQGVDLAIHRQSGGIFNVTFLETACPPHHLGAGDFDADGISDVAFFDQAKNAFNENETSLSVVYGNAFAAPNDPVPSGNFSDATGLSPFQAGPMNGGTLIAVTRKVANGENKSALGIIEIGNERAVAGPWYLKSGDVTTSEFDSLWIVGLTVGTFSPNSSTLDSGVVTLGQDQDKVPQLWLATPKENAELLDAHSTGASATIPCLTGCLVAAVKTAAGTTDHLFMIGDTSAVVYKPGESGFTEETVLAKLNHTFSPLLSTTPPPRDNVRPFVADVDHDGFTDVLVLATNGALVGFFGDSTNKFTEVELLKAPNCWQMEGCGNYAAAMLNVDGDAEFELLIAGPELPGISNKQPIGAYEVVGTGANRTLESLEAITILDEGKTKAEDLISADSDYVNMGAGDIDGDGVTDLVFMPSSNYFTILRGVPGLE